MNKFVYIFVMFVASFGAYAKSDSVCILTFGEDTSQKDAYVYSVTQMLDVAGMPFKQESSVEKAIEYKMIVFARDSSYDDLSAEQITTLNSYVSSGGVIVAAFLESAEELVLFGVTTPEKKKTRHTLSWKMDSNYKEFQWFDDELEQVISLGAEKYEEVIKTLDYQLNGAETIATYDDGTIAATRFTNGSGKAYLIGVQWKAVIAINLCNKDYEAQRSYSNGFEPTTDVFCLLMRGIYSANTELNVWKHTIPGKNLSALMITHDCDSKSSYDTLNEFVDYEVANNIPAHYFVTTRYMKDGLASAYYNTDSIVNLKYILDNNLTIGSHSVGHFPDMADSDIFPEGDSSIEQADYNPSYNDDGPTVGGTMWGECKISKKLLETDLGINVKSWRSGHLAFNKKLTTVLQSAGYSYNSTMSSNDILHNFPYMEKIDRQTGESVSTILEIPMTISDVYSANPISEENYPELVSLWSKVYTKYANNHSPCVLLIHPNRTWKVDAQKLFVESLPTGTGHFNFDSFAEFWLKREALDFSYEMNADKLTITISDSDTMLKYELGLVLETSNSSLSTNVIDSNGTTLNHTLTSIGNNRSILTLTGSSSETSSLIISVLPEDGGTLNMETGAHCVTTGESFTLKATPASGYKFDSWTASSSVSVADSTLAETSASLSGNGELTANFVFDDSSSSVVVLAYSEKAKGKDAKGKISKEKLILVTYDRSSEKFGTVTKIIIDKKSKSITISENEKMSFLKNDSVMLLKSSPENDYMYMLSGDKLSAIDIGLGKEDSITLAKKMSGTECRYKSLSNWEIFDKIKISFDQKTTKNFTENGISSISGAINAVKAFYENKGYTIN